MHLYITPCTSVQQKSATPKKVQRLYLNTIPLHKTPCISILLRVSLCNKKVQRHPLHKTPCISILLRVPLCNKKCNTKKSATPHPLYLNAIPFIKLHSSLYYSVYLCATKKVQRLYLNTIPFIKLRVPLCNKKCNAKKKCNATLVRLVPSPCP